MNQNNTRLALGLIAAAMLASASAGAATVSSTFDSDNEGWSTLRYTLGISFDADLGPSDFDGLFGNGAGSISASELGPNVAARFSAPAPFTGDLSAFVNGTISFQLIIKANPGASALTFLPGAVVFENAAANLAIGLTGSLPVAGSWTTYSAQLSENGIVDPTASGFWSAFAPNTIPGPKATQADIELVLSNVTRTTFTGEVTDSTDDTIALDNVHLTMVPIPASLPLLAAGLFGVRVARTRRRRNGA